MFDNLAIVDVETTGGSPVNGRIIEIGVIRVKDDTIVDAFETLVNPEMYVPPEIEMLTGIDANELEHAPTFYSIKDQVYELLQGAVFVAHNSRFDYSFIQQEFKRVGVPFSAKQLCSAKLSKLLFPTYRHHNLDSIIDRFGITCESRHRAMGDTKVVWEFLQQLTKSIDHSQLVEAIKTVSKDITLPPGISRDVVETLPESPGVYTFYNAEGAVLYIGKSVNLKDRILSHFQNATRDPKEAKIFTSIASLEVKQTDGELGALLEESRAIKLQKPLYNRLLREAQGCVVCTQVQDPAGYFTVELEEVPSIAYAQLETIMAVFKTLKQAKKYLHDLALEHTLCNKLLGLEHTTGACFGSQLQTCNGACQQRELAAKYNLRFLAAFQKTKIKQWPFRGAIAIREGETTHLVSHWCYIGTVHEFDEHNIHTLTEDLTFEYDTYKILHRYLLQPHAQRKISVLR